MSTSTDDRDIARLRATIESKLEWGGAAEWHSSMYSELSDLVFEQTQVMLSQTTLKRFFGAVNHTGLPSITTLDALSRFAGFENWREFKHTKPRKSLRPYLQQVPAKSVYVSAGFGLAFIFILLFAYRQEAEPIPENMSFSSRPVTTTYPNSVVFDLDLKNPPTDCLFIQQYWDVTKTIRLTRDQTQATGIYYYPGYFRAKLLVNGEIVTEHDLFLKSDGWLGTIEYEPVPKYFTPVQSDSSSLDLPSYLHTEISELGTPLKTVYQYIDDLGDISADNFVLKATVQNTFNDRWAVCEEVQIYVIGTTGAMIVPFAKTGCSSDLYVMLNDNGIDGKKSDLSRLGSSFEEPVPLQIRVVDQNVEVQLNDQVVLNESYNDPVGRLVGVRFKFLGTGKVLSY